MEGPTDVCVNIGGCVNILTEQIIQQQDSSLKSANPLIENSSDDDEEPVQRIKKRLQHFSDSDVEEENFSSPICDGKKESDNKDELIPTKNGLSKSRIKLNKSSSESEENELKNEQQIRLNNKRIKMKRKFHSLLTSRAKSRPDKNNSDGESSNENTKSENTDNEMSSIAKIKQKIKKSMIKRPSICDPDTSDEENNINTKVAPKQRQKKTQKATKIIEAQPIRMSAKQAMENMQLIKSESNRMLREKAVSLPYHRPKALTLKDIMSRRKPAVSLDGKVLPIKMNEEQLKQYALQLEQRQKEMIELCKSESDEESVENCEDNSNISESKNIEKPEEPECNVPEKETVFNEQSADLAYNEIIENVGEKSYNDANGAITKENALKHSDNIDSVVEITEIKSVTDENRNDSINTSDLNDSNTDLKLHYKDDSIEENVVNNDEVIIEKNINDLTEIENESSEELKENSEQASQCIHLTYTDSNTERFDTNILNSEVKIDRFDDLNSLEVKDKVDTKEMDVDDNFKEAFLSDDDVEMADIDLMIENAEIIKENQDDVSISIATEKTKPKLKGAPGMVIDLDGNEPAMFKRSGVELLKEKFTYFSKLKTPEEIERQKEKRLKPGAQHLKLKQDLEEKIAEQRSLEWAKRLEEEKHNNQDIDAILDDDDELDSIDKIKAKEKQIEQLESESEEELLENDVEIKDKPRKYNPMLDNEAEESDIDAQETEKEMNVNDDYDVDDGDEESVDSNDSSDETSESEGEDTTVVRKGRILKAFEDSDDENTTNGKDDDKIGENIDNKNENKINSKEVNDLQPNYEMQGASEDDVIQLAQRTASVSEDLFTSQDSAPNDNTEISGEGTQSFSISSSKPNEFICPSQPYNDPNLKEIADGFPENINSQSSQSQPIGEDILALCTGKFYENEFVSQNPETGELSSQNNNSCNNIEQNELVQDINIKKKNTDAISLEDLKKQPVDNIKEICNEKNNTNLLNSILDELNDPEFDKPKENKYFVIGQNKINIDSSQMKKRLVIDSDDEVDSNKIDTGKKKKLKKKKLEDRALQYSDAEDEEILDEDIDDDIESDLEDDSEKLVDYDSEENEIVIKPDEPKKKKKTTDFFEQEAELTSEDEWVGSGDEDERGLDRMEREEGDDDVFHQGKLRKELGQIHMRDVLDQDKREVRLIQELLFEDGDLGGGHRQRKFRWRNTEDEEAGTFPDELADTQEEEFESEEQWRKQRHEREVFLRQMQKQDEDETAVNVSINRTTIIKANLSSKSMSTLLMEANQSKTNNITSVVPEKNKDLPSPKKTFSILKQNYHGSLLTRGRGALARLAALATPLAVDDDAPKIGSLAPHKRNFVFTALTQEDNPPKVSIKRKAEVSTPKLMKKIKTDEKQSHNKNSLLDHINL